MQVEIIDNLCKLVNYQLGVVNPNEIHDTKKRELLDFFLEGTIGSEGAEDLKKFTESNITAVNIVFTPGEDFQNLRSRATFNPVASRIAQAATLKAEKASKGTVDLNAAKGKTSASTNENNPSL